MPFGSFLLNIDELAEEGQGKYIWNEVLGYNDMKFKATIMPDKGSKFAAYCFEYLEKAWQDIQDEFKASTETEREELAEHFNDCIDGLRIGDALFADE